MDRYRIKYICNKKPADRNIPAAFEIGMHYIGRSFNDLFEISPSWGSDVPTKIVTKKIFEQYFELVAI